MSTATGDDPPAQAAGPVTLLELLRDRPFALYLLGQTTSGAGSALSGIALAFAVLSISHSPAAVGLVLLASRLPNVALALAGGIIADRWSRRLVASWSDLLRTIVQLLTGALLLSGSATVPELMLLQLLSGGAGAVFGPAANALLAGLAPRGQIRRASSLLGITTAVTQLGGLAVSGVIVALAGPGTSFVIDAATFAVSSATMLLIPEGEAQAAPRRGLLTEVREGWQVATAHGWLIGSAVHETIVNVLALGPFFVLGPVLADARLGGATAWSAIALGYVAGNLAAAHISFSWAPARPIHAALWLAIGLAPMLALIGLGAPLWLIVACAFVAGAQSTLYNTMVAAALQANLPGEALGRVTAFTGLGSTVLVPVGMGLAGWAAARFGASTIMLGGAVLVVVATVTCGSLPAVRAELSLDHR